MGQKTHWTSILENTFIFEISTLEFVLLQSFFRNKKKSNLRLYSEFFLSECGKIRARKTPNTNTFHAVTAFRKIEVIWSASRRCFKGSLPQIFLDPILNTLNNYVIRFFTYRSWFLIVRCIFMSFFSWNNSIKLLDSRVKRRFSDSPKR